MILVPNVLFLFYLLGKICRVMAKFRKNDSPMFFVCLILVRMFTCYLAFSRVRTIPSKAPNTQYPIILAYPNANTQYQYQYWCMMKH